MAFVRFSDLERLKEKDGKDPPPYAVVFAVFHSTEWKTSDLKSLADFQTIASMRKPRVIIVMGVSGSGKSTVSALLATRNGGRYVDADEFHPPANIQKMAAGTPLTDIDRWPWLERLRAEVIDRAAEGQLSVLACSALKKSYRKILGADDPGIALVFLHGTAEILKERLEHRAGHYMKAGLLESQLAALEEPQADEALVIGIEMPVTEIVESIERALGLQN